MKRTREEYDNAIVILGGGISSEQGLQALAAMRELRDSAFALEEALVNLREKAQAFRKYHATRLVFVSHPEAVVSWDTVGEEVVTDKLELALHAAAIALAACVPPAPATPLQPHQNEEIMGNGEPEPSVPPPWVFKVDPLRG